MKLSRLPGSIDSSNDDKRCRNVKRNSGHDLMTVGLNYFMEGPVRRDIRVIEDSSKDLENSDLCDVDSDYLCFLTSDLMSFKKSQDKEVISIDGTNYDPQYEMFLSCLKPYGTSCILEVSETNGLPEPIIYELCESDELLKSGDRVLRSHSKCLALSKDCLVNSDGSDSLCRVGLQEDVETKRLLSSNLISQHGVYLSSPEHSDDVIMIEDEDDDDDDDDDDSTVKSNGEMSSDFRKDLIEVLRQPYDDRELKKLYDKIRARKPIDRHMDLRDGRETSVPGEKLGKSYLDWHFVLRKKLEMAEDSYEKLNLLRGFFFYLQNAPRGGAFEPWEDAECLAVLPQPDLGKRKQRM